MENRTTPERIPGSLLRSSLLWNLGLDGKSTSEVENEGGIAYGGRRDGGFSWHRKGDLDARIGLDMGLGEGFVKSEGFADFKRRTLREILRLEKSGQIEVWRKGRRMAVVRAATGGGIPGSKPVPAEDVLLPAAEPIRASEDEMASAFNAIMRRASKDNTYKFALARAILAHCRDTGADDEHRLTIQYDYLADEFLRYYWHQECKFRIKQDFHVDKEPNAVKIVRAEFRGDALSDFRHTDPENRTRAKRRILADVFGSMRSKKSQVVPKFQRLREGTKSAERKMFYAYDNRRRFIELRPAAFDFFKRYHAVLLGTVLLEWTRLLERTNNNLPHLVAKIEADGLRKRSSLAEMRKDLYSQDTRCFYCGAALEMGDAEVDHFIPWSYIFEDEIWNLVLACRTCNRKKSDSLAGDDFVEALVCRNRRYADRMGKMDASLRQLGYRREWQEGIWECYESCAKYGFERDGSMRPTLRRGS